MYERDKGQGACAGVRDTELEEDKIWLLLVLFTSYFFSDVGDGSILGGIVYVGIAHSNQARHVKTKKKLSIEIASATDFLC
ncbi:hypothetical protein V8C42DRAFT_304214 [Trichoderma barbatum]